MNAHPRWPLVSTSFTSVPKASVDRAKALAGQADIPLWQFYAQAIDTLVADLAAGATILWPASRGPGGAPYAVRLPETTVGAIRRVSDQHQVKRTTVFLAALARALDRAGTDGASA